MQLGFIMPSDAQRQQIGRLREQTLEMRQDQIAHLEHLLRSWGIFGRQGDTAIAMTWRAIKRTLRDLP
jgi:hypothetical protein